MIIRRQDKGSHYYRKNGEAFYVIEKLDGTGLRPVTVRDAFKHGCYRSVTNVLSVLDKPGLDFWKSEQVILSALTLPRLPGENEHEFAERVFVDAQEQARKAAAAGTRLHELAAGWLVSGQVPAPASEGALLAPFMAWCQSNLDADAGLLASEVVVLNHEHGYAGRLDLAVRMKDGSIALLDLKTQEVGRSPKNVTQPGFYDEFAMQLAAYSRGIFADGSYASCMPWRLISVVIDRKQPGCYTHEWTTPGHELESSEPHFQAFLAAARVWSYLKKGTPGIDLKKAA